MGLVCSTNEPHLPDCLSPGHVLPGQAGLGLTVIACCLASDSISTWAARGPRIKTGILKKTADYGSTMYITTREKIRLDLL
jgi:hypothetical protein